MFVSYDTMVYCFGLPCFALCFALALQTLMFYLFGQIFFINNNLTSKLRTGCIYNVFPLAKKLCKLKFSVKLRICLVINVLIDQIEAFMV